MTMIEDTEEDKPHVGWKPRVVRGGKGPPEGPVTDWLSGLEEDTVFVCSEKNNFQGNLFKVIHKRSKFTLVQLMEVEDTYVDKYVNNFEFTKKFPEYEVLGVDKPPTEEVENEPEQCDSP